MSFDRPKILIEPPAGEGDRLTPNQRERFFKAMGLHLQAFDTWKMVQNISGHLDGEIEDWPSHIQDAIHAAVEKQCVPKAGENVKIVAARCYNDGIVGEPSYVVVVVQAFPIFAN